MFNLPELLQAIGLLGIFAIIFAETGLLLGFFLPGDSLIFTAGILASQGFFNIYFLLLIMSGAAIIGDSIGYGIGKKLGPRLFSKEESMLFKKSHIAKAQAFFDKHGPKTIIIARFVPIVRTFAPTLAGVGKMNYSKFLAYNIFGGLLWVNSLGILGYYLGLKIHNIEVYILPGVALIILLSIAPYIKTFASNPEMRREAWHYLKRMKDRIIPKK